MDWHTFLTISHIIGTVLGAGGATFAEVLSFLALKDNKITDEESEILKKTFFILRIGLFLVVISGFGFLILERLELSGPDFFYNPRFLAKMTIVAIIALNALAMQFKIIPQNIGSPISLISWYSALILGSWRSLEASYIFIMIFYVLAVFISYFVLNFIKNKSMVK